MVKKIKIVKLYEDDVIDARKILPNLSSDADRFRVLKGTNIFARLEKELLYFGKNVKKQKR